MRDISVIIPVLNENENISKLVRRLVNSLGNSEFIFVDDGSKDGTIESIQVLSNTDKRIKGIFNNVKLGHMGSYLEGIKISVSENIVIMDGDLQHPPEVIPEMLRLLEEGNDVVIGSRYKNHKFLGNRDKKRGIISRGAEYILKTFVKECRGISDPISGFVAFKKHLKLPITPQMRGNKLLPFLIVTNPGIKVGYVNYKFTERSEGQSKIVGLNKRFIPNYIREVIDIKKTSNEYGRLQHSSTK